MFLNDLHAAFSSDLNSEASIQNDQLFLSENSFFTQKNLSLLWLKFQIHWQWQSKILIIMSSQIIYQTLWDICTCWSAYFEKANMIHFYQLIKVNSHDDFFSYTWKLHSVFEMLLNQCDWKICQHSILIFYILHYVQFSDHILRQSFNLIRQFTLQSKYIIWWHRLLLFLLYTVQSANVNLLEYHIFISVSQRNFIQNLNCLLQISQFFKLIDS